ncbi:GNAT family N-acetyltransferase [Candidatus Mycobacterium methanotrophicum]|uniref:N-acetyltransferase Eis n=1 Tax=Candidatus Mycobacterium methanotrophicum TaxID=2943498 RepID=A0ABY4QMG4_9MYCO|nr:GNAT family N-acetyltransferase [Candidatus Mycobacterium methanotrophicum]UQX11702.1 GNAT family N-acetyltransferase [Candidatus Mycobacterium methanotrophicum]
MTTTDDALSIRHPTEEDLPDVYENQARAFGDPVDTASVEAWKRRVELDDILVAEDVSDPQQPFVVGTSIIYQTRLTVPGGASLRAAWLTMIAVASTHQRQGVWAQLSAKGLGILMGRGYPVVCGVPTQTAIYDGFGAGVASYSQNYCLDRRFAKLRNKPTTNRAREVNAAEARRHVPEIYQRWCAATSGAVQRNSAWWNDALEDRPTQRGNGSELNCTIHPDGFLTYRVMGAGKHAFRPPFGTAVVEDFCPITDEAHTELLQTLLALQMFDDVKIDVSVDDPLPLKLTDLRAAEINGQSDWLWVRINDIPEVLGARAYTADVDLVLEVNDPLGLGGGRFLLQTRDGVGKCAPHEGSPDVELGLAELATIYTGAHRAPELFRANRIAERRDGGLRELDAAFRVAQAPFCGTLF